MDSTLINKSDDGTLYLPLYPEHTWWSENYFYVIMGFWLLSILVVFSFIARDVIKNKK